MKLICLKLGIFITEIDSYIKVEHSAFNLGLAESKICFKQNQNLPFL